VSADYMYILRCSDGSYYTGTARLGLELRRRAQCWHVWRLHQDTPSCDFGVFGMVWSD